MLRRLHVAHRLHSLLVTSEPFRIPRCLYARQTKRNNRLPPGAEYLSDPDDPLGFKQTEEAEALEDWLDIEERKHLDDVRVEENQFHKRMLHMTIEQKFFKPPQEVNLLTWDAKEQIRYLHQEFPDEWTTDRLSQSFPISSGGIRKLLKSKYNPKTLEQVIKHDTKVQQNWKALKSIHKGKQDPKQIQDGPLINRYRALKDKEQVYLLANAAGISSLPMSDWQKKIIAPERGTTELDKPVGMFESIVKGYLDDKKVKDSIGDPEYDNKSKCLLDDHLKKNQLLLENFAEKQSVKMKSGENSSNTYGVASFDQDSVEKETQLVTRSQSVAKEEVIYSNTSKSLGSHHPDTSFQNDTLNITEQTEELHDVQQPRIRSLRRKRVAKNVQMLPLGDDDIDTFDMTNTLQFLKSHNKIKTLDSEISGSSAHGLSDIGMEGTIKLSQSDTPQKPKVARQKQRGYMNMTEEEVTRLQKDNADSITNSPSYQPIQKFKSSKHFPDNLQFDNPSGSDLHVKEPFIYDPEGGYHHPYGRITDAAPSRLHVPRKQQGDGTETVLYQDGNNVYDEDGEFLYKIP